MLTRIQLFIIILLIHSLTVSAHAASVHGTIYAWSDFEKPLKNAIVEVNSTPIQSKVTVDGTYSFDDLSPGNYMIKAKYYRNNILEYIAEEDIQIINKEGSFTIDLLLFPPTESEYEVLGDINLTSDMDIIDESDKPDYNILILILILISMFSAFMIFKWNKKKTAKMPENIKNKELPEDLHDLYDIILKMGGRVTQKNLRKEMKCSEAKVSLMIADLEDRGFIKKIKKGRSNIIIAEIQK